MRYAEVADIIASIGVPYAYRAFTQDTAQEPPYIVYYYDGSDDMYADNINYQEIAGLRIEVYTRNKDFSLERNVENALKSHDISWSKEESFIDSENLYMIIYESEVLINGE